MAADKTKTPPGLPSVSAAEPACSFLTNRFALRAPRIKQDKVELQTSAAAEVVAHCHFANECLMPVAINANQHDRKVTGYPVGPKSCAIQEVIFDEGSGSAAKPDWEMRYFQLGG